MTARRRSVVRGSSMPRSRRSGCASSVLIARSILQSWILHQGLALSIRYNKWFPATAADRLEHFYVAWRFAIFAGKPRSQRLPDPLSEYVPGSPLVVVEPHRDDGGPDIRIHGPLPQSE